MFSNYAIKIFKKKKPLPKHNLTLVSENNHVCEIWKEEFFEKSSLNKRYAYMFKATCMYNMEQSIF